jgi:Domain of unknown function (DUF222)
VRSDREDIVAALDAIEAGYRTVSTFPLETLSRSEGQALLVRLEKLEQKWVALDRKLLGRLVSEADPAMFVGASQADVLARRLRISPGEARRRIAEAAG